MSSTSYPISMNTKDVFNDLRNQAKKRPELALSDIKVSGNTLWLGGILTTSNARFYYVERHTLSSYAGQISVKSESVDMGFTGNSIPAEILKKLTLEEQNERAKRILRGGETGKRDLLLAENL